MERIKITGVGSELQGVGKLNDGRTVFVPGAIPGETVDIDIKVDKGRFCEASLNGVIEASSDRAISECPHAERCGGCLARHMTYEKTLELKKQVVYDALSRIGGIKDPEVFDTIGDAKPDRTRNKAEYPIAMQNGRAVIGAYAHGSREIIALEDCLSQSPISARAMKWLADKLGRMPSAPHLRFLVTRVNRKGEMMLTISGDVPLPADVERLKNDMARDLPEVKSFWYCRLNRRYTHALDGRCTKIDGDSTLTMRLFDLEFLTAPQAFFQVNAETTEALYSKALEAAGIGPGCDLNVLDAYCGAGTISLCAARMCKRVVGVEIVAPAIENAKANAKLNKLDKVARFVCADAAREIPKMLSRGERFDAAIVDPPRKGCDPALLDALAAANIKTIAYVSCNPATLARDVKVLAGKGYKLKWAQPVDMFPWTGHVETVVLMSSVKEKSV